MRMVLHELFPAVAQKILGIFLTGQGCQSCQRLRLFFEGSLAPAVLFFQFHMGGAGVYQSPEAVGFLARELAADRGKTVCGIFFQILFYCLNVGLKIGMDKIDIGIEFPGRLDGVSQILLHRLMVAAVHEEKLAGSGKALRRFEALIPVFLRLLRLHGNLRPIVVPVGEEDAQKAAAVHGLPVHLGIGGFVSSALFRFIIKSHRLHAATESHRLHAGLLEKLGHLTCVSEGIREIAHRAEAAELFRLPHAGEEVAHGRLTAGQELILKDVPGAHMETAFLHIFFQFFPVLRADLQIVVQNDGLPVQMEIPVTLILFKKLHGVIHQFDEFDSVFLKR